MESPSADRERARIIFDRRRLVYRRTIIMDDPEGKAGKAAFSAPADACGLVGLFVVSRNNGGENVRNLRSASITGRCSRGNTRAPCIILINI